MKKRRKSRELALQVLYSFLTNSKSLNEVFKDEMFEKTSPLYRPYAMTLIEGCVKNEKELDEIIAHCSINWNLNRIACIEKILLRMGLFEMIYSPEVPPVSAINEAVDLAKKFSGADSGRFVNGILDHYYKKERQEKS
ncbi:MAG: transcription antitermination factor NusB [Candidatus Aureabacteria bacterium]|nr:transcription antitermination factor NusB [Candidatus Auribacterota bacterium]